ncbi:DUF4199 domain-containing protein [Lacinutrix sp.]|uniref:DUF4199 domain-containing protein n=1 Tax=Lacinutrix sp. TaxID=1937692 RepID=UPI0025BDD808|nr:DUF4199 domain-containing protein [Lacinutrix sp.]
METLQPNTIKSSAINYGLYLAIILAGSSILAYVVNLDLLTNFLYGSIIFILTIGLAFFSVYKAKKILNGFITFKQAFTAFFITIALAVFIKVVIDYVLFNFIDAEAAIIMQEKALDTQVGLLQNFGMSEEQIALAVEAAEDQPNLYSLQSLLFGLFGSLAFYSIIGLIVALIMKRNPENA